MVKRQTVWLSTMMVLSLMLIGYYTMNNGAPGTGQNNGDSITTETNNNPPAGTTNQTNDLSGSNNTAQPQASAGDALINDQTQVSNELAKRTQLDLKIIDNSNATSDQIQTATLDLKQVNALTAGIANAESAVEGQGYPQCAVVPNASGDSATVYVQTKSLTPLKAAVILDAVSQNTGISPENIHVQPQS